MNRGNERRRKWVKIELRACHRARGRRPFVHRQSDTTSGALVHRAVPPRVKLFEPVG